MFSSLTQLVSIFCRVDTPEAILLLRRWDSQTAKKILLQLRILEDCGKWCYFLGLDTSCLCIHCGTSHFCETGKHIGFPDRLVGLPSMSFLPAFIPLVGVCTRTFDSMALSRHFPSTSAWWKPWSARWDNARSCKHVCEDVRRFCLIL